MKYQEYVQSANRASQLVEGGDYEGAIAVLQELLISAISDVDKAMMCLNLAIVYDKLDRPEEALTWYDKGMEYERAHGRHYVAEMKAAYLAEKERYQESLAQYEDLLSRSELTEGDKERMEKNIRLLRKRVE
jgi:tetratricopeptide (TPR) repeat protein